MSEENIEIVRKAVGDFNAFMRGELTSEEAAEILDPQIAVSWQEERVTPDLPRRLLGAAELIRYGEQRRVADLTLEPVEFIEAPDGRLVTPITQWFGGREGRPPVETHFTYVWTVQDGKVHRVKIFLLRADALEAAGLRE